MIDSRRLPVTFPGSGVVRTGPATAFTYTVTVGPVTTPISLETLKSYLRIPASQTSEDALLTLIIELVTLCGERYTRRDFISKTYKTFRDIFFEDIVLRRSRLVSVESINFKLDGVLTLVDSSVYSNTFESDFSRIFLQVNEQWPGDVDPIAQAIEIEFISGYGSLETDVPADLRGALLQHAANFYENRGDCPCDGAGAELALPSQTKKIYMQYLISDITVTHQVG